MQVISRQELMQRLGSGVETALVEVLGPSQYREFHLPGAINVPLDERFDARIQEVVSDKTTPVVVYCQDESCDAAARAARRMHELGYQTIYDCRCGAAGRGRAVGLAVRQAVVVANLAAKRHMRRKKERKRVKD